jgi:phosphohistidine phosphatase
MRTLLVIRHAIAHQRSESSWPNDDARPLTRQGASKFVLAARGLKWLVDAPEELLTSPLIRTRQTAEILERKAGFPGAIDLEELRPEAEIPALIAALKKRRGVRIAIVGHEPNLSLLIGALVRGVDARTGVQMKKGAAAHLEFATRIEAGKGRLVALVPPRVLRAVGRAAKLRRADGDE